MTYNLIEETVEKYLQREIEWGANSAPNVALEMRTPDEDNLDEWPKWLPIGSTVTDEQIAAFEDKLKYKLPDTYKAFLKYKHFYELHIGEASFFAHSSDKWQELLKEMIFDGYPREFLYDRGLLPFAHWSDWGLLCFDTNVDNGVTDYPVVIWDHDSPDDNTGYSVNFEEAIKRLDKEDRESWGEIEEE